MGGVSSRTLTWVELAAAAAAAACVLGALRRWKALHPAPPRGLLQACVLQIVEHAQSAAVLLLAMCAFPALVAPLAWAAFALAPRTGGLLVFLPLAVATAAAALLIGALAAASVCWLALRRVRAEKADFGGLLLALGLHFRSLRRGVRGFLRRPEEVPFNPFVLPALLDAQADLPAAAKNAAAFAAAAPEAVEVVMSLHSRLTAALVGLVCVLLPLSIGFFGLPLVSYMGYSLDLSWGIDGYAFSWASLAALLCGALALVTLLASAALVHASTVYLYGTGGQVCRERALRRLKLEWVWPSEAKAAPPPPAPSGAAAPARAPAAPAEYAQERALPAAGRAEPELGAGLAAAAGAAALASAAEELLAHPSLASRALRQGRRALYRAAVVLAAAAGAFYLFAQYDGFYIIRRLRTLSAGTPLWATVESLQPAPKGGFLQYRLVFSYRDAAGLQRGEALAGESASAYAVRGRSVAVYVSREGAKTWTALADDFGFTAQRGALLLALTAFLLIGAWSFAFRVL